METSVDNISGWGPLKTKETNNMSIRPSSINNRIIWRCCGHKSYDAVASNLSLSVNEYQVISHLLARNRKNGKLLSVLDDY